MRAFFQKFKQLANSRANNICNFVQILLDTKCEALQCEVHLWDDCKLSNLESYMVNATPFTSFYVLKVSFEYKAKLQCVSLYDQPGLEITCHFETGAPNDSKWPWTPSGQMHTTYLVLELQITCHFETGAPNDSKWPWTPSGQMHTTYLVLELQSPILHPFHSTGYPFPRYLQFSIFPLTAMPNFNLFSFLISEFQEVSFVWPISQGTAVKSFKRNHKCRKVALRKYFLKSCQCTEWP